MTRHEAGKLVALALANWPAMQSRDIRLDITAGLWHRLLADIPYELAEQALTKILITAKFWPTVAEIREAADSLRLPDSDPPPAGEAWGEVCRQLDPYRPAVWSHPAIAQTVQRLGGVRRLCESENTATDRAHFLKIYTAILDSRKQGSVKEQLRRLARGGTEENACLAGGEKT